MPKLQSRQFKSVNRLCTIVVLLVVAVLLPLFQTLWIVHRATLVLHCNLSDQSIVTVNGHSVRSSSESFIMYDRVVATIAPPPLAEGGELLPGVRVVTGIDEDSDTEFAKYKLGPDSDERRGDRPQEYEMLKLAQISSIYAEYVAPRHASSSELQSISPKSVAITGCGVPFRYIWITCAASDSAFDPSINGGWFFFRWTSLGLSREVRVRPLVLACSTIVVFCFVQCVMFVCQFARRFAGS
jgi:hypothetical protein